MFVLASADGRLGPRLTQGTGHVCPLKLDDFAGALGLRTDVQRPVRDRTALEGEFDLELEYVPFSSAGDVKLVRDRRRRTADAGLTGRLTCPP
jgi:hypothetical protein